MVNPEIGTGYMKFEYDPTRVNGELRIRYNHELYQLYRVSQRNLTSFKAQ